MVSKQERAWAIRFILCLGVVSLFADMTYEGAYSIIGPFLKDLGATATQVGLIAGLGEMIAASLRLFSGRFADRTRAYWSITIFGYALNVLVVPMLALAGNWQMAALLVVAERTGKALRGPARDVLLSEATSKVGHGFGFGVHSAMDQTGAVIGPLMMAAAVARANHFGPAFARLIFPAAGALLALLLARAVYKKDAPPPPKPAPQQALPRVFWMYVAAAGVLACGFVDFPLLAYHFQKTALAKPAVIPLLYAGAMGVNGLTALIAGRLFDRYGIPVLSVGILVSLLALPLGFLGGPTGAVSSAGCWAVGLGAQDACLRAGISQVVSMNKRGGAFGAFNGIYGVMWFLGSATMGLLYDHSLMAVVVFGVLMQLSAAGMFFWLRRPLAIAAAATSSY
ncbi:MAG TPA: MFS transporter [Bryobacteraceae bacterium]|jgi:predicted MFS family arabinose efflux permease|nr:MFS transporter [Bryobacteraceae bacterium]